MKNIPAKPEGIFDFHPVIVEAIEKRYLDIPYANKAEQEKLDIYLPPDSDGPFPVIIMVHGGGWSHGDKRMSIVAGIMKATAAGYAVASINYRTSLTVKWPEIMYDIKAAIRFLRANADRYHLDSEKFAIMGESAGAHLAAFAATTCWITEYEDLTMGNAEVSSDVQACVVWYCPFRPHMVHEQRRLVKTTEEPIDDDAVDVLFGVDPEQIPDTVIKACPDYYLSKNTPPFMIEQGLDDRIVPYIQAEEFAEKLREKIGEENVELVLLDNTRHAEEPVFNSNENISRVIFFLDRVFFSAAEPRAIDFPEIPLSDEIMR